MISLAVPAAGWVVASHPEITPPSNFHHFRDTTDGYRLARLPEVLRATGLPRTTIYKLMAARDFPRSIKLGPRAVAWRLAEVHAWISQRAADNRCKYEAPSYGAH